MNKRVSDEIEMLRAKYPNLEAGEGPLWVHIPNYPLPSGVYNKEVTRLLYILPVGYPNTGPDNFFVDGDLKLKNDSLPKGLNIGPKSGSGHAPLEGNWAWFSWHPKSWTPDGTITKGDNLLTFMRGVNACLRGEQET